MNTISVSPIRESDHIVCNDIKNDPKIQLWRERALDRGYRSSAAFPLKVNGETTGAINFYSEEVGFFNEEEIILLDGLAADVSFALEFMEKEEMLVESEKKFRDLYDNAPNAYYSIGSDGRINKCNKHAALMLGYAPHELIGRERIEIYADTPDGREKSDIIFERFKSGMEILDEEVQMKKKDGTAIWVSLTVNAFRDSAGELIESRSMAVDITERKQKLRKPCIRYERKHSLSVVHIDWHESKINGKQLCTILDDASRYFPALSDTCEHHFFKGWIFMLLFRGFVDAIVSRLHPGS